MTSRLRSAVAFAAIAVIASASTVAILNPSAHPSSSVVQSADSRPAPAPDSGSGSPQVGALALTPTEKEYVYVPIAPCRIVDTRTAGGKLAADAQRAFVVKGSTGFAAQGGVSTGCGIPDGATAASFSFTTTESTGKGRLNAFPEASVEPRSTSLSYTNANKVTSNPSVALRLTGSPHLRVHNYDFATHLVVDVTGYYIGQMYAYVNPTGTISRSSRVVSVSKIGTGTYNVTFDTNLTGCVGIGAADYSGYVANVYPSGGAVMTVYTYNPAGVPTDYYFNIAVHC